ncbi:Pirin [Candidatus Hydrogenisulfobacillus filiaventi]|uniref:Pirin n=1 Tax=Candidatus Hydrogenisulfobacillus filiaventi TaxID=2707344 RepID=A0A6F8ZJR0_9FIRM|nr:Pirin [Candidatus Hydrogenisulfobacillus filiaventi]
MEMPVRGLTAAEARARLQQVGPNEIPEERPHPWIRLALKFWGPVPWMLEATIVLSIILHRTADAVVIAALLLFNAVVSVLQEGQAENALALLRERLPVMARVLRDGQWQQVPARELVPDDIIHLRMGDVVPADVRLAEGSVLLDQSMLTGESVPQERGPGQAAYAGSVVRRGEATGTVTATGARTYFGKTAVLVQTARTLSHLESLIFRIVRWLVGLDGLLVMAVLMVAAVDRQPLLAVLPFSLMLLVASVPVALPATFTLAQALGAKDLAAHGVLVTRLSAIEEAATMDVLCTDKTGTITDNRLSVSQVRGYSGHTREEVLGVAALASDAASEDPLDLAVLEAWKAAAAAGGGLPRPGQAQVLVFHPFDPALKRTEAEVRVGSGRWRVMKGAPQTLAGLVGALPPEAAGDLEALGAGGQRVLGVAAGPEGGPLELIGLLALEDPPRADSATLVHTLQDLGVRVMMLTGDTAPTARAVAEAVGINGPVCEAGVIREGGDAAGCGVLAGIFPEDKFHVVTALQKAGHVVGMTGDGVNDAPALKAAEVGVAVASATDVAKAAASLVLTRPGLMDAVEAVQESRRIYQRMHTYILNKIIKTLQVAVFLSGAYFLTGRLVTTPFLIVLLLFANDFVTMSLATDRVRPSRRPARWRVRYLVLTSGVLALLLLVEAFLVLWGARDVLHLGWPQVRTVVFLMLVASGQATVYVVREVRAFWRSRPSRALLAATLGDLVVVGGMAWRGILMAAVPGIVVWAVLGVALAFMVLLDLVKQGFFHLERQAAA